MIRTNWFADERYDIGNALIHSFFYAKTVGEIPTVKVELIQKGPTGIHVI
jgi:hypothetical protein